MSSNVNDYPPGTVAVATVRGNKGVRAFRMPRAEWVTAEIIGGCRWHNNSDVTDVRPLVVLDLGEPPEFTVGALRTAWTASLGSTVTPLEANAIRRLADQIEAQTKPPRIPEPGLWGVVEARVGPPFGDQRLRFVRYGEHAQRWAMEDGDSYSWDELIDPVLIREGVES